MTGLLEFLGRPADPSGYPAYLRRCKERIFEIQKKLHDLDHEKQRLLNEVHEIQDLSLPESLPVSPILPDDLTPEEIALISADLNADFPGNPEISEIIDLDDSEPSEDEDVRETTRLSQSQQAEAEIFCELNPQLLPDREIKSFDSIDFSKFPIPVLQMWCAHFGLKSRGVSRSFMLNHLRQIQLYLSNASPMSADHQPAPTAQTAQPKKPRLNRPVVYKWFADFFDNRPELMEKIVKSETLNLAEAFALMDQPPAGVDVLRDYFVEYNIRFT